MKKNKAQICWCGSLVEKGQVVCRHCQGPYKDPDKYRPLTIECRDSQSKETWILGNVCCICFVRDACRKRQDYVAKKIDANYQKGEGDDQIRQSRMA